MVSVVDADLSDVWTPVTPAAVTMERKQRHHYGPLARFECARKSSADITLITERMSRTRARTLFPSPLARTTPG